MPALALPRAGGLSRPSGDGGMAGGLVARAVAAGADLLAGLAWSRPGPQSADVLRASLVVVPRLLEDDRRRVKALPSTAGRPFVALAGHPLGSYCEQTLGDPLVRNALGSVCT